MSVTTFHRTHIDCLRGYAILMVIACHTAALFSDLPWRFRQVVSSGWHGVQLFFVASTFTLLMSYERELLRHGRVNWTDFFIRRFCRIAPAYYLAAVVYELIGNNNNITLIGTAIFAAFLNAWVPYSMGQSLVPGAWSISVEFTFYLLFPLIATYFHTRLRAALLLAVSVMVAVVVNAQLIAALPTAGLEHRPTQFVYFGFSNQFTVFALANFAYLVVYTPVCRLPVAVAAGKTFLRYRNLALLVALGVLAVTPYLPLPQVFLPGNGLPPAFWWSAIWLAVVSVAVSTDRPWWLVNPLIARIGQVSFSAYLWHFAVLDGIRYTPLKSVLDGVSGSVAILLFPLVFAVVALITYCVAYLTFRFVETPGIDLGKRIIQQRRAAAQVAPAAVPR